MKVLLKLVFSIRAVSAPKKDFSRFLIDRGHFKRIYVMGTSSAQEALSAIRNWPELALQAGYRVGELARLCKVKLRVLRIFFARRFKRTIKMWLREQRIREAKRRLKIGERLKDIKSALGYCDSAHLTRDFKAVCQMSPRQWMKLAGLICASV